VIYQVGEKVLADFVLCHLDNPSDKLNLLMYDRLLNTPPFLLLLCCWVVSSSSLCYVIGVFCGMFSPMLVQKTGRMFYFLLVGTPQNLMYLVFLGFALKILQLHATEAFCSSRWHSSSRQCRCFAASRGSATWTSPDYCCKGTTVVMPPHLNWNGFNLKDAKWFALVVCSESYFDQLDK